MGRPARRARRPVGAPQRLHLAGRAPRRRVGHDQVRRLRDLRPPRADRGTGVRALERRHRRVRGELLGEAQPDDGYHRDRRGDRGRRQRRHRRGRAGRHPVRLRPDQALPGGGLYPRPPERALLRTRPGGGRVRPPDQGSPRRRRDCLRGHLRPRGHRKAHRHEPGGGQGHGDGRARHHRRRRGDGRGRARALLPRHRPHLRPVRPGRRDGEPRRSRRRERADRSEVDLT